MLLPLSLLGCAFLGCALLGCDRLGCDRLGCDRSGCAQKSAFPGIVCSSTCSVADCHGPTHLHGPDSGHGHRRESRSLSRRPLYRTHVHASCLLRREEGNSADVYLWQNTTLAAFPTHIRDIKLRMRVRLNLSRFSLNPFTLLNSFFVPSVLVKHCGPRQSD